MRSNYEKMNYNYIEELILKVEELNKIIRELKELVRDLKEEIKNKDAIINKKDNEIQEMKQIKDLLLVCINRIIELEQNNKELNDMILKLKNSNNKDSSNSSKAPSTDKPGKKNIPNNREASNKPKGGQPGHKAHILKENQVKELINNGKCKYNETEVKDKNDEDYNEFVLDLNIDFIVTKVHHIGKNKVNKLNNVVYGNNIKSFVLELVNEQYCSMDGVVKFISDLTSNQIKLSKGTIYNWQKEAYEKLETFEKVATAALLSGYFLNCDDSQFSVNGEPAYQHCTCNNLWTVLKISDKKSREAIKNIGIVNIFNGIVVKDGTHVYETLSNIFSQCLTHILRYIKGAYQIGECKYADELRKFLSSVNVERNELISKGVKCFAPERLEEIFTKYNEILNNWISDFKDKKRDESIVYTDEKRLLNRLSGDEKEEILYFINDFKVPSTNNQAERDQRGIKKKNKIGKFRSYIGAEIYARIKSFIISMKKQDKDIITCIKELLAGTIDFSLEQ